VLTRGLDSHRLVNSENSLNSYFVRALEHLAIAKQALEQHRGHVAVEDLGGTNDEFNETNELTQ
jgi:hypothetical protein